MLFKMSSVFHRRNSCVFDDRTLILFLCELILICLWVVFSFSINMLVNRSWKYILDSIDISSQILFYPNPHKASNTINMSCFKAHKNMWHCELTKYKWKILLLFFFFLLFSGWALVNSYVVKETSTMVTL